jgi:energy-coupling factor transporter transmembrane protein EcfT
MNTFFVNVKKFISAAKKQLIWLCALAVILIALSLLKQDSYISEYIFARGISRYYIKGAGAITSLFSFSLFELIAAALIFYLIYFIVRTIILLVKKSFLRAVKRVLTVISVILCVVILYNITASFSYNRYNLNLNLYEDKPEKEQVYATAEYFLNDYNAIAERLQRDDKGNIIPPYSFDELSDKLREEFSKLGGGYFGDVPRAKPMLFSEIMSYMQFSGVFMSITAEPNINTNIPPKDLPAVMAHEMAHAAGVMRENEANLLSYYILLNSDDEYLRYSGYNATFDQMLGAVYFTNGQEQYESLELSPLIIKENHNAYLHWKKYESFFGGITEFFNDLYLKLSGVKEGTISYDNPYEVVDSGETDEQGEIIYEIEYSAVQKIYFTIFGM